MSLQKFAVDSPRSSARRAQSWRSIRKRGGASWRTLSRPRCCRSPSRPAAASSRPGALCTCTQAQRDAVRRAVAMAHMLETGFTVRFAAAPGR